jgi:hypothetical protein
MHLIKISLLVIMPFCCPGIGITFRRMSSTEKKVYLDEVARCYNKQKNLEEEEEEKLLEKEPGEEDGETPLPGILDVSMEDASEPPAADNAAANPNPTKGGEAAAPHHNNPNPIEGGKGSVSDTNTGELNPIEGSCTGTAKLNPNEGSNAGTDISSAVTGSSTDTGTLNR